MKLARNIVRRKPFSGQQRLKTLFEKLGWLHAAESEITTPLLGHFRYLAMPGQHIDRQILFCGDYEYQTKQLFAKYIKPGDVVMDVGANTGFHTLFFSELAGPKGSVLAFEPMENNRKRLEDNLLLNGIQNVKVLPYALGEKDAEI